MQPEYLNLNTSVGVERPDLRSRWEPCVEKPRAPQRVLNRADSWLSTSPVVSVLTQWWCYPRWQNAAPGPEHPSQPFENRPASPGRGILTDTPDPDPDSDLAFLSSHKYNQTCERQTGKADYYFDFLTVHGVSHTCSVPFIQVHINHISHCFYFLHSPTDLYR